MLGPTPEKLAWLRERYKPGARVKLMHMDDPYRPDLKAGTLGTVIAVDDIGTIHVGRRFFAGRGLRRGRVRGGEFGRRRSP